MHRDMGVLRVPRMKHGTQVDVNEGAQAALENPVNYFIAAL